MVRGGLDEGPGARQLHQQLHHVTGIHLRQRGRGRRVHQGPHRGQETLADHFLVGSGRRRGGCLEGALSITFIMLLDLCE